MTGEPIGPLTGVPVCIKDLVCTQGIATVSCSVAYWDFGPEEDDVAGERLRNAGTVILDKTNVSEFRYGGVGHKPVFETTRSP